MTDPLVPELDFWALMLGRHIMTLAQKSRVMGHSNPAATVMYIDPNRPEWPPSRDALHAALDFAKWCSHGAQDCEESVRFLDWLDEISARPQTPYAQPA